MHKFKKSKIKLLLYLVLPLVVVSCSNGKRKSKVADHAILTGVIKNAQGLNIKIKGNRYDQFDRSIDINDDGSFLDTLKLDKWNITYEVLFPDSLRTRFPMYISAGDNLHFTADLNDVEHTLQWSGSSTATQNYLIARRTLDKNFLPEKTHLHYYDEDEFVLKNKELMAKRLELLSNTEGLTDDFREQEEKDLYYDYLRNISTYEFFHGMYINDTDNFEVSEGFGAEWDAFAPEDEDQFFKSFYYEDLVYNKLRFANSVKRGELKEKNIDFSRDEIHWFQTIEETIKSHKIKQHLFVAGLASSFEFNTDPEYNKRTYEYVYPKIESDSDKMRVDSLYAEKMKMAPGSPSPVFIDYRNHDGSVTSLTDLKGKYTYIDFWATWCGPCKKEFPALKEVEKSYHGKNIQFVGISVDEEKDFEKWKKMVNDLELEGVQLFADAAFTSAFVKRYGVISIPRYILLDPEGNIVSVNAPRPSDKKLIELFDSLGI